MNDELPEVFSELTPREADAHLRARVLAAVDRQLADANVQRSGAKGLKVVTHSSGATAGLSSSVPWRRRVERFLSFAVAACLLIGIGLNAWRWQLERRIDAIFGPSPMPSNVADTVRTIESVTDKQTAEHIGQQLLADGVGRATTKAKDARRRPATFPSITSFEVSVVP